MIIRSICEKGEKERYKGGNKINYKYMHLKKLILQNSFDWFRIRSLWEKKNVKYMHDLFWKLML